MAGLGKIFILGDSYSTFKDQIPEGYASYYPKAELEKMDVLEASQTWWHLLMKETRAELTENCSFSGTTVCNTGYNGIYCPEHSFIGRLDKRIEQGFFEKNPVDTILVFGGTNDSCANSPVGELQYADWTEEDLRNVLPAFGYLFHRLREVCPRARVISILNTDLRPEITQGMIEACRKYGIECVILKNIEKVGGHPNCKGMRQIADQILEQTIRG